MRASLRRTSSAAAARQSLTTAATAATAKQAERELELSKLKAKLDEAEAKLRKWSDKVEEAIEKGDEKAKIDAEKQQFFYKDRVEALEKQIAALAPPALKVLQRADFSGRKDSIIEFFAREIASPQKRMRLDSKEIREKAVREFSSNLFMDKGLPQIVLIRDCYRVEADKTHRWMGTKPDPAKVDDRLYSVFIGGTRGVGKSIFGTLMVFEFVDLGYAVLYEHKMQRMLMIGTNLMLEQKEDLVEGFKRFGYDTSILSEPGVYEFVTEDATLFQHLTLYNRPIHVQDLGEGSTLGNLLTTGNTRRLILSSPRDDNLKNLTILSANNVKTIFMPLWTPDELETARELCYPSLDKATVAKRFQLYGGVARHVLQYSDKFSKREFAQQLKKLKPTDLDTLLGSSSYSELPPFRNVGFLIHVAPKEDDFTCVYASEYAFKAIIRVCLKHRDFKVREFAGLLKGRSEAATLYGRFLEEIAHHDVAEGGSFSIHDLDSSLIIDRLTGPVQRTVEFPSLTETVLFEHISEIATIQPGVYYRPTSKTYETIDAFALMDGSLLDSSKFPQSIVVLVLFQVTVSERHRVNGARVKEIHNDVYQKWTANNVVPSNLTTVFPRVMVFPTRKYPRGIHTYQKLTKADKGQYADGQAPELTQYSLTLERDYEEISNVLAGRIPEVDEE